MADSDGMDALQISGKWYISAKRAAKEHNYHADYIGQLIRSGKVKGQKVGRSWYVRADSLTDYFGSPEGKSAPKAPEKAETQAPEVSDALQTEKEEIKTDGVVEEKKLSIQSGQEEQRRPEILGETSTIVIHTDVNPVAAKVLPKQPILQKSNARDHVLLTYLKEEEEALPEIPANKSEDAPASREELRDKPSTPPISRQSPWQGPNSSPPVNPAPATRVAQSVPSRSMSGLRISQSSDISIRTGRNNYTFHSHSAEPARTLAKKMMWKIAALFILGAAAFAAATALSVAFSYSVTAAL